MVHFNQLYKKSFKKVKVCLTDLLNQTIGPLESWEALYLNRSAEARIFKIPGCGFYPLE